MEVIGGVRTDGWRDESDRVAAGELNPVGGGEGRWFPLVVLWRTRWVSGLPGGDLWVVREVGL